ncbi:MAG: transposase [Deltaproteobacteria bacterium]|nr:transposase [Deltaproteobacteria bacterium]MBP7288109.1 transposase [Nannocystaceae bacterium]
MGANGRRATSRMLRYMLRPPFAHDAVRALADGRVRILFEVPTRQGATHVDVEPERFLARLVGLVPPPRQHQVRYFGVFSNHHALRSLLRPAGAPASATPPTQVPMFDTAGLRPWPPSTSHSQHRRVVTPRTLTEGAQGPHRLGQTTGARVCHRRHRLPTMRWAGAHHRCHHRRRRDRSSAPRCKAAASSAPARTTRFLRPLNLQTRGTAGASSDRRRTVAPLTAPRHRFARRVLPSDARPRRRSRSAPRPSAILPAPSSARTLARSLSHCTHEPRLRYPLQTS